MNTIKLGLVSAMALATAAPAFAQYHPTPQYQRDYRDYQAQRAQYERSRSGYESARRDYERRRADWRRARADYDARYGYGAYVRAYGPEPAWDDADWAPYAPSAAYYGRNSAYTAPAAVRCNNNSTVAAGIIGALAGAALGSNVAARNARTEGAVLGAVVGGGLGAAVGRANDRYKCDARGPYFTYRETVPYREAASYRTPRYSSYARQRCRLAPAPVDSYGEDYRYVRVCPDRQGRYRITG